jgi:hypothetical protein
LVYTPPLHIQLLFAVSSVEARAIANAIVKDWMSPPGVSGLRVPVFLTPEDGSGAPPAAVQLDDAEHTVVAVLVDADMVRRVGGHGAAWAKLVSGLVTAHPAGGRHHILLVALTGSAFDFDDSLEKRHFLPLDKETDTDRKRARVEFALAVRGLRLLRNAPAEKDEQQAPVTLFASHAKRDLDPDLTDPVRRTQDALRELPVREWFDAREIREGADFETEIRAGIERADAMLVFLTDAWATRPACRMEALAAKELATPVVVVDALDEGEIRRFPYGGNLRALRWRAPLRAPVEDATNPGGRKAWEAATKTEAERVIVAGIREALGRTHVRRRLEGLKQPGDIVLDVAPEAAWLAWQPADATFLYPDPPLGAEEQKLLELVRPGATFETPMKRFVRRRAGKSALLGVSISETSELARAGLTETHELLITDEVHLYLLLSGLRIAYGGKLEPEKLDDPKNFTLRLFSLVRSYRDLARSAGAQGLQPILNTAPWPLWKQYDNRVSDVFGRIAELDPIECPPLPLTEDELSPQPNGFVPPVSAAQRYAWCRALTHMRDQVTQKAAARLSSGGKIEGYLGRMAGVLEESLLSLRAERPLFLAGGLGGCTELVIDLIEGRPRAEMTTAVASARVKEYEALAGLYTKHAGEFPTREALVAEFGAFGVRGPGAALRNGLDDAENRELFRSRDPIRIAELVLTGLERLGI